jgi:hypothetical protein
VLVAIGAEELCSVEEQAIDPKATTAPTAASVTRQRSGEHLVTRGADGHTAFTSFS